MNQAQQGEVFLIKDILKLKCRIQTGNKKDEKVPFTNALTSFNLEMKESKTSYREAREEPVLFKYKDPKDEKIKTGWLNNLGYVPIKKVNRAGPSLSGNSIKCANLISKGIHPSLRARSNHSYDVKFQVIGRFVRVLLLAPKKDLPYSAVPYSLKVNENLYAMPIGGYTAQTVDVDPRKNPDWEDTNILFAQQRPLAKHEGYEDVIIDGIPHSYPKGVKYVQVMNSNFQPYKTLVENRDKKDVYPKGFFQGDWFYAVTPVQGTSTEPELSSGYLQHLLSLDATGFIAQTVRFSWTEDLLVANSINKEKSEKPESEPHSVDPNRWVLRIPVKHRDYRSKQIGKDFNSGLQEVIDKRAASWELEPWAALNFNSAEMAIQKALQRHFSSFKNTNFQLDELTFSSDYFSFLIKDETRNHSLRFSFLKKQNQSSSYTPLYLSQEMLNLFPAFYSMRRIPMVDKILQSEEFQKRYTVERFNIQPEEPIRYYLSDLTPKEKDYPYVHTLAKESINIWNQVFEKASVPCPQRGCFTLEKKTVPLGDIRYNVFNFIDPREVIGSMPAQGFGPSMSDYETGEIISATTNINTLSIRKTLVYRIHQLIQKKMGMIIPMDKIFNERVHRTSAYNQNLFLNQRLFMPSNILHFWKELNAGVSYSLYDEKPLTELSDELTEIYGFQGINPITSIDEALSDKKKRELRFLYELKINKKPPKDMRKIMEALDSFDQKEVAFHSCDLQEQSAETGGLLGDRIYSLIDTLCGDSLSLLIPEMKEEGSLKKPPSSPPHEQKRKLTLTMGKKEVKQEILSCADKILPLYSLLTTLHEQGHNITMRHQFKGSSDKDNFLNNEEFHHDFIFSHLEQKEKEAALRLLQPESSSVMDYVIDPYISPGAYDIAFARYYYAHKIETKAGSVVQVNFEDEEPVPIDVRNSLKKYKVCADKRASLNFMNTDIFCNVFDKGFTPLELVENYYNRYIKLSSQWFLNKTLPRGGINVMGFFLNTKKIYNKWRRELSNRPTKEADPINLSKASVLENYLQGIYSQLKTDECDLKEDQVDTVVQCLCNENSLAEEHNKDFRNLFCAKEKIVNTLLSILFKVPDHYCEIKSKSSRRSEWIPFVEIHGELTEWESFSGDVSSCSNKKIKEAFKQTGWNVENELGYPLFSRFFSTNENHISRDAPIDYRGSFLARFKAGALLKTYFPLIKPGLPNHSFPFESVESLSLISLMDEFYLRDTVRNTLLRRISQGIPKSEKAMKRNPETEPFYYNFKNESLLWQSLSFPLLAFSPSTNIGSRAKNAINTLIKVLPMRSTWTRFNNLAKFHLFLKSKKNRKSYFHGIFPEPNILTKTIAPRPPIEIIAINSQNYGLPKIFQAMNNIELALSFKNFFYNLKQMKKQEELESSLSRAHFRKNSPKINTLIEFEKTLKDDIEKRIIEPVSSLLFKASSFHLNISFVLTYSILSDYLIDGTKFYSSTDDSAGSSQVSKSPKFFLADHVVETLQAGSVIEYILGKSFLKKCEEIGLNKESCPSFHLPENLSGSNNNEDSPNSFMDPELREFLQNEMRQFSAGKIAGSEYFSGTTNDPRIVALNLNLFASYFDDLLSYIENLEEKEKEILFADPEFINLISKLFKMEAFKPGQLNAKDEESKIEAALLSILKETVPPGGVKKAAIPDDKERCLFGSSNINVRLARGEACLIKKSIRDLSSLIYFPNSRFLREMFFLSVKIYPYLIRDLTGILSDLYAEIFDFVGYRDYSSTETPSSHYSFIQDSAENIPKLLSANYNRINKFLNSSEEYLRLMQIKEKSSFKLSLADSFKNLRTVILSGMINSLFENQDSDESQKISSYEREGSFKFLLQNRMLNEIQSQEDILFSAIKPLFRIREDIN